MAMIEYERMKDADFLYYLYRNIRKQIPDEELDKDKEYTVKISGEWLLMILYKLKKKYRQSRRLKNYVTGRRPYYE